MSYLRDRLETARELLTDSGSVFVQISDDHAHLVRALMDEVSKDLFAALWGRGTQLITDIRRNMKNKQLPLMDKIMLRGRSIIETINDQLKNQEQIEH